MTDAERKALLPPLLLGLLVLALHAHTLSGFFLGDDYDILRIVEHQEGWADALRMKYAGNWGPVSYTQFYVNFRLGGFNPVGYHLVNLFWLWVATYALYRFVRTAWSEAPFAAWAAALLFATHPVHDEAVSYICSRSHTTAAALAMVALWLHARLRLEGGTGRPRWALGAVALAAAFVGALSKESALTIPAWIFAFEWLFARGDLAPVAGAVRALVRALPYFAAAGLVPLTRLFVVGGAPPKLEEASADTGALLHRVAADASVYGLYGTIPLPFSWMSLSALAVWRPLGWLVVAAAVAIGLRCFLVDLAGPSRFRRAAGIYLLGLVIACVTLLPVIAVQLPARRRYLYIASFGIALAAAAALERLRAARPRAARALLAVIVIAFAAGLVQRNELYRRSGKVAKSFFDAVLQAPDAAALQKICLVTMPRFYAGDNVSGAYLLHYTDIENGLNLFGVPYAQVAYPLKCEFADDYTAEAEFVSENVLDLRVKFRTRRAYEAARVRDPEEDARKNNARAKLLAEDPAARELRYRVILKTDFWDGDDRALFLYTDGRFERLPRP